MAIVNIDDSFIVGCVFDRIEIDKMELESRVKELCKDFLKKYPNFKFENISVFDVYCDLKCIVNIQLK